MKRILHSTLVGFLLFAMLFTANFSIGRYGFTSKAKALSNVLQTGAGPNIVVDGNLSDWAEVSPIINGTTGEKTSPDFYGITECYILIDQGAFYFVFQKKPGGSDKWQMFFDTDLSNQTGFLVNGMGADYMFDIPSAIYHWDRGAWLNSGINLTVDYDVLHGGTKTPDGSVIFAYGYVGGGGLAPEWWEGKVDLSLVGNPRLFSFVFELPIEHKVAPETSYILVSQTQTISFGFSYTGAPTLYYGRPTQWVFNLLNFGPSDLNNTGLEIVLPKELAVASGQTTWQRTISAGSRTTLGLGVESFDYGRFKSYCKFSWFDASSNQNQTVYIPSVVQTVPSVSLSVAAPSNMTAGIKSSLNITLANLDPLRVPLTIELDPLRNLGFSFDSFEILLSPNATIQLPSSPIMPTTVGYENAAIRARYDDTGLVSTGFWAMVYRPHVYMKSLNVSREMQVGVLYTISAVLENEENASYAVSFSIDPGPGLVCLNGQSVNVVLPANSNTTASLLVKPVYAQSSYATFHLDGVYGEVDYPEYSHIELKSAPLIPASVGVLALILGVVIVLLVLVVVLGLRRRSVSKKTIGEKIS